MNVSEVLQVAHLFGADLAGANLEMANLGGADLRRADLTGAQLVETTIENANLSNTTVYGISAWNLQGTPVSQTDLVITKPGEPVVTVDDLKVAQFVHLLLSNPNMRDVIDTITSKAVWRYH